MRRRTAGAVESFAVAIGDAVQNGDVLLRFAESESNGGPSATSGGNQARSHGAMVMAYGRNWWSCAEHVLGTLDAGRPEATERRHAGGGARPGRTSTTCATRAVSWNTARFVIAAQRAGASRTT